MAAIEKINEFLTENNLCIVNDKNKGRCIYSKEEIGLGKTILEADNLGLYLFSGKCAYCFNSMSENSFNHFNRCRKFSYKTSFAAHQFGHRKRQTCLRNRL